MTAAHTVYIKLILTLIHSQVLIYIKKCSRVRVKKFFLKASENVWDRMSSNHILKCRPVADDGVCVFVNARISTVCRLCAAGAPS